MLSVWESSHPAADDLVAQGRALVQASHIPPGQWFVLGHEAPWGYDLQVERGGLYQVTYTDAMAVVGSWSSLATVSVAWLLERVDSGLVRFAWSELGHVLGYDRMGSRNTELLRAAVGSLCRPSIHARTVNLEDRLGVLGRTEVERVDNLFAWPPQLHLRGDGRHHPSLRPNRLTLAASGRLLSAAWRGISSTAMVGLRSDISRRLWLVSSLATLRPADADGLCRCRIPRERLPTLVGSHDGRSDRLAHRLAAALEDVIDVDPRFAGSYLDDDALVVVRGVPRMDDPRVEELRNRTL